jgi:cyclopropane fatty-acyl-phospholipid synthase-like methyltransferase
MFNIAEYLHHLEIKKGHVIGDLGCGIGKTAQLLAKEYPDSTVKGCTSAEPVMQYARF